MSDKSEIQWTDATWNPSTGCTKIAPECANCYIERTPPFRMAGRKFSQLPQEELDKLRSPAPASEGDREFLVRKLRLIRAESNEQHTVANTEIVLRRLGENY